jgi:hypothetical protein
MTPHEEFGAEAQFCLTAEVSRRELVQSAAAVIAATIVAGHTPYGQWTIYRQRNLFIVASRTDSQALNLAKAVVEGLTVELPESHARLTRASDEMRIASLLATAQLDVAVISQEIAAEMFVGSGVFKAVGPVPLRILAELDSHLLVTVDHFKSSHAFLLAAAVEHLRPKLTISFKASKSLPIPYHVGVLSHRNRIRSQ